MCTREDGVYGVYGVRIRRIRTHIIRQLYILINLLTYENKYIYFVKRNGLLSLAGFGLGGEHEHTNANGSEQKGMPG